MQSFARLARGYRSHFLISSRTALRAPRATIHRCYATQLDLPALDAKWRQEWEKRKSSNHELGGAPKLDNVQPASDKKSMYILPMFPYPSGKLHLGHLRVYTIADVVARFRRLQGHPVLLPMGWDAFGLPAENAAIERGVPPAAWTTENMARMKEQLQLMNGTYDWSREIATCDPNFYKHTQRIFLLLLKNGLASRKAAEVNWDPVENTVLANEQVDADGRSWRSGAKVEKRNLEQWFFHITKYQESLLQDLETLAENEAWPERVLAQQRNWLGRDFGAHYDFQVKSEDGTSLEPVRVYTTRPETIYAAQFIALSPSSPTVLKLAENDAELRAYLESLKSSSEATSYSATEGYKIPYLTATNPLDVTQDSSGSKHSLPVYVAAYVRGDYETGALMGVPAHDLRDFNFWSAHQPGQPIKFAVTPNEDGQFSPVEEGPFLNAGYMTSLAGAHQGLPSGQAAEAVVESIQASTGSAKGVVKWKLRDWLISRQRYWGTPIPIVHCGTCGPQPVPDEQLPITLPEVEHHWKEGRSGNPLESATDWINTTCPKCKGAAKRDTDTMDTFVDSSWYYMRFADPQNADLPVSEAALKEHLPVDVYIGGVEHAILHLLYARFIYKTVVDLMYSEKTERSLAEAENGRSFLEPFTRLITQGMVHGKTYSDPSSGRFLKPDEVDLSNPSEPLVIATGEKTGVSYEKMSKSKHNGVDPTDFISKYGADATRAHMLFQAPVSDVVNWDEDKIAGVTRWLRRLHDYVQSLGPASKESSEWAAEPYFTKIKKELDAAGKEQAAQCSADTDIWRATQQTVEQITKSYEKVYSLNTTVSLLMGLTNTMTDSKAASPAVKLAAMDHLLRMMAPITPSFAEECWRSLYPSSKSIFDSSWPEPDGTIELLGHNYIKCAVMVNGKMRCVATVPHRPSSMEEKSREYQDWLTERILQTEEAQAKLANFDIRKAKKAFIVKGGKTVNYLL
ncbi:leucyl-tRNA synthetase [Apiospora arundinis]|uniref:leucine--tRNA ligase n=1 Tax=Apiospora arundinis TaxID=335852 RepID=A0ABR2I015_9PEZI